jgi:hypothetical protein
MDHLSQLNGMVAEEELTDVPQGNCKSTLTFQNVKFICEIEHEPPFDPRNQHQESGLTDNGYFYSILWRDHL